MNRRRWDDNDEWAAFAGGLMLGMAVASIPPKKEVIVVQGSTYYYANGVYYVQASSGYQVAPAPAGAVVAHPPANVTNVYVNNQEYGYSNGTYYQAKPPEDDKSDPTYEVVTPPVGSTVDSLPDGASQKSVDGTSYFVYAEAFYRPFYSGSDVVYRVVADPTSENQ